jgi:transcriptional regulator with XRE-family HTH domain
MSGWDKDDKKNRNFGDRLRKAREDHGLSRQELARRLGVAVSTLQNYEEGGDPKGSVLYRVAKEFDISVDWLLGISQTESCDNTPTNLGKDIVQRALQRTNHKLTKNQQEAIIRLINDELKEKAVAMISALKGEE